MCFILRPWQFCFVILTAWIHKQQQDVIEHLPSENQVLQEKLGKKRILLNDDQRRRLAGKGKSLGRKRLAEVGALFTPDTILRWHRVLVAQKCDYSDRHKSKPGRPHVPDEVKQLVLRMAEEKLGWGYDRIQGDWPFWAIPSRTRRCATSSRPTALNPRRKEIAQPPGRHSSRRTGTSWLPSISPPSKSGRRAGRSPITCYSSWKLKSRRVQFAGCTTNPRESWMKQIAKNLINAEDGFLSGNRYLLMDRIGKFCPAFPIILETEGVRPVLKRPHFLCQGL